MKFDLHIHSAYSDDSDITPEEIIKTAENIGLDGIAFLDHNSLEGYFKSKDLDTDLIIIPAMEVSTRDGHIMALGVQEEIEDRLSIEETTERIREIGGLSIAVHPNRLLSGLGEKKVRDNDWDAIEGFNSRSWAWKNEKAQKLADDMGLPVTGGSDAHRLKTIGKAFTFFENVGNWEDAIEEIERGNTDVGGESRTLSQNLFYVKRTFSRWVKRGFRRI
ncbi:MAG: PHP domain-containing protein [Candidatus Thermoplasmatota archaeon]